LKGYLEWICQKRPSLSVKESIVTFHCPLFFSFSFWCFLPYQIPFASRAPFCYDCQTKHAEYNAWWCFTLLKLKYIF
jgi:hypothetical protein